MNDSPRHSVSVAAAIVDDDGHVLAIQRRDNGHWEPPGGVLELDETVIDGLRREVREETGLEVEPIALTGVYKNMVRGIVALVFRCGITGGTASRQTGETTALRWLTPAEISELMEEAYAVRLVDAIGDRPPAVRAHDGHHVIFGSGKYGATATWFPRIQKGANPTLSPTALPVRRRRDR